ncbi:cation diffusion facilitator family transporter [soil metagenome]
MEKRLLQVTGSALVISVLITAIKFVGFRLTQSQAVYSDFLESIVNVVVGVVAIFVVRYAAKPADQDHPYGHGKIEYFSAAFEGGLIAFAAVMIFVEAVPALLHPRPTQSLGLGAAIVFVCGLGNLALGVALKKAGRSMGSPAIIANAEHIMSDFVTSAGVTVALLLAQWTGLAWLDSVVAIMVGVHLAWTGLRVVRRSASGLLDEEDREILTELAEALKKVDFGGVIQIHNTRIMRSGRYHHIDAHAVVPEFWDVAEAHDRTESFESRLLKKYPQPGELHLHVDPCRRAYCRHCDVPDCPIRVAKFESRFIPDLATLISPEEPEDFRKIEKNI